MMLASPLVMPSAMFSAQSSADEPMHYRPAKDLETFNSLLPPPVEFIEGSSSGTLAVADGKYEAINASPKIAKAELPEPTITSLSIPTPTSKAKYPQNPSRPTGARPSQSLYQGAIDLSWPVSCNQGLGLHNSGNTCFLNSALQCLLHTPPLLRLLLIHKRAQCPVTTSFCMTCALRSVAVQAYSGKVPFLPSIINSNLHVIAKHMRKGRQEDTHEFLRYAIDALQKSCLAGLPPKLDAKITETTWVHKLFGGRLRSRVSCRDCGHNSDTFDRILDLSLDIFKCESLKDALKRFIAVDYLKGADKYKCEKCQKHVNAEKNFTIHEAPLVLTVHLKRFSPLGRKISHPLHYDEELTLQPYMSAGSFGPTYSLYGVICHAGGGPNSGHYYAFVKSREGRWSEMNDEMVTGCGVPTDKKNAYMLFYIQNKGQGLQAAVKASLNGTNEPPMRNRLAAGMKKKSQKVKTEEGEEDKGIKVDPKFIGPLLAPAVITSTKTSLPPTSPVDPQAASLKAKITAAASQKATQAMAALGAYDSDDNSDKEDRGVKATDKPRDEVSMDVDVKGKRKEDVNKPSGNDDEDNSGRPSSPPPSSSITSPSPSAPTSTAPTASVPATSFYANLNTQQARKRKLPETELENRLSAKKYASPIQARSNGYSGVTNPYNKPLKRRKRMGI